MSKWVSLENGVKVLARVIDDKPKRPNPGNTALHEAKHALIAEKRGNTVKRVSIMPTADYNGVTELSRPDPVAAAGPHADGMSGTGWDVHIIRAMGTDEHTAGAAAKSILSGNEEEVYSIAQLLEERGAIGSGEVRSAMDEVHQPKREKVELRIIDPKGEEKTLNEESENGIVIFDSSLLDLPKAS
jgi:hypothetical protein